jgi:D-alanyl-D-alanine carboxypeptidase
MLITLTNLQIFMHTHFWSLLSFFILFSFCRGAAEKTPSSIPATRPSPPPKPEVMIDSSITKDYLTGQFMPEKHPDFVEIPAELANRKALYLRKEALQAYKKMQSAAKKEGVFFTILSATRNFNYQKGIWEAKWEGRRILSNGKNARTAYPDPVERALKILEYSSMPGTSRHHWGTDIDLNNFNNSYFESGKGAREFTWLQEHAGDYGFFRPYTAKGPKRPNGYNEEKWHWSYFPLADPMTKAAAELLKDEDISGFKGAETAVKIQVVKNYILGVHPSPQQE